MRRFAVELAERHDLLAEFGASPESHFRTFFVENIDTTIAWVQPSRSADRHLRGSRDSFRTAIGHA